MGILGSRIRKRFWETYKRLVHKKMETILFTIYGKRRVEIEWKNRDGHCEDLIVKLHFPKIHISNAKGLTNTILDLYVRVIFKVSSDGIRLRYHFQGVRETFSFKEYLSGYSHSHLPGINSSWDEFCFGDSNTPMNALQYELEDHADWLKIEMLFLQIPAFLEYESVEGVPYRWLKNLAYPDNAKVDREDVHNTYHRLVSKLYEKNESLPLEYKYAGQQGIIIVLQKDKRFNELLVEAATKRGRMTPDGTFINEGGNANLLRRYLKKLRAARQNNDIGVSFKGRKLKRIILRPPEEDINQSQDIVSTHAHPELERQITSLINKHLIQYSNEHQEEIQYQGAGRNQTPSTKEVQRKEYTERFKEFLGNLQHKDAVAKVLYRENADARIINSWENYGDFENGATSGGWTHRESDVDSILRLAESDRFPTPERGGGRVVGSTSVSSPRGNYIFPVHPSYTM